MPNKTNKNKTKTTITTNAPVAKGTMVTSKKKQPQITYRDNVCVVTHSEYISDVIARDTSTATSYPVNPQSNSTFTWLSAIATRFEMYRFRKLKFHYKPSCSTITSGYVILGMDFDFYDPSPTKPTMLAWKYSSKSAVWQSSSLDVSMDSRMSTPRYCNVSSSQGDSRLDMLGNLWVLAFHGTTLDVGEVYVEYTVEFLQPSYRIPPALYCEIKTPVSQDPASLCYNAFVEGGNMLIKKIPGTNGFTFRDVGKFIISFAQSGTGQSTHPVFNIPNGTNGIDWVYGLLDSAISPSNNRTSAQAGLEIIKAPLDVYFSNTTGDAGAQQAFIRFATYAVNSLTS